MRRLVLILPWLIVLLLAGTIVFLLTRIVRPWETRSVNAAPVVMAIRKIAQFSTVEVQVSDVVRYEEAKHFLVFDFPKSATLRLRGRVLGGFDLESPQFQVKPDTARKVVRVRLPRPRILAVGGPDALDALGPGPARGLRPAGGNRGEGAGTRPRAGHRRGRRVRLEG